MKDVNGNAPNTMHNHIGAMLLDTTTDAKDAGIVVGTSATGWSFEQNSLVALIPNGTSYGYLVWNTQSATTGALNTHTYTATMIRTFTNSSGGSITVQECGLQAKVFVDDESYQTYMFSRDVPTAVPVSDGGTLTVTYTLSVTDGGSHL